jgi:hypothetical protein
MPGVCCNNRDVDYFGLDTMRMHQLREMSIERPTRLIADPTCLTFPGAALALPTIVAKSEVNCFAKKTSNSTAEMPQPVLVDCTIDGTASVRQYARNGGHLWLRFHFIE